jgi:hypothetical protein
MAGDARRTLLEALLQKVNDETYPSTQLLDLIEELLAPEETAAYVAFLVQRVNEETYPSMPLLRRIAALV